ncbi:MAG TPA: 50S ribosomal protein L25 [Planctomycetes bacterium]|nr:50S ribosomal protein L25 [Planctomycetota bacterium]
MQTEMLKAEKRSAAGKSAARTFRDRGLTPCVIYGRGEETRMVAVPTLELEAALRRGEHIINVTVEGEAAFPVFVKEVQYEVLSEKILHVDFMKIRMDENIEVEVAVLLRGEAAGLKTGGLVEHVLHSVTVSCLPDRIPESIVVDVNGLNVGDAWHVSDLKVPEGVEITDAPDTLVVSCHMPRGAEEEETAAIPEEATQPELIGEKEEEEAEALEEDQ